MYMMHEATGIRVVEYTEKEVMDSLHLLRFKSFDRRWIEFFINNATMGTPAVYESASLLASEAHDIKLTIDRLQDVWRIHQYRPLDTMILTTAYHTASGRCCDPTP